MMRHNLKFTHNTFEYYELCICPKIEIDQIKAKLADFKLAKHNGSGLIVVSFTEDCDMLYVSSILDHICKIATDFRLKIHSIKKSESMKTDSISGVQVIDIPSTKKSKPIINETLLIDEPVRSGVRLYNDGDIIITSFVSNGAEVIASGNIHVYGELRGRALAGSGGNKAAKIFAVKFNPELISVGGVYRVIDSKLPDSLLDKFVVVSLDERERLNIATVT